MASEAGLSELSSLIERLITSRNRDLSVFLPLILAFTDNPTAANPLVGSDSSSPDQETGENVANLMGPGDRIILVNPITQGMIVIEGSGSGGSSGPSSFDSLIRDIFGKDGPPPASKASMEAMPVVEINEPGQECVICLEEWEVGGVAKEMPCNHRFHGECIEKWLKVHGTCPVCRHQMPEEGTDDKSSKTSGENGGRRRHLWVSFSFSNNSGSDRSGGESHDENGSNHDSVDSSPNN